MSEIEKGEIKEVSVDEITENPWNPNEMDEDTFEKLKQEYERIGYLKPILVRPQGSDFEVVDGEHRLRAAREKGLEKIQVVVKDLDDEESKKTTLNMNDIKGSDNPIELAEVLDDLTEETEPAELEEDLVMDRGEIEQHDMLLDLPDDSELTEEDDNSDEEQEQEEDVDEVEVPCPHCGGNVKIDKNEFKENHFDEGVE